MHWTTHLLRSFADQTATWFVGVVLALLGVFSGRLVENLKFALNRADLRTKYYEQLAIDLSSLVFLADRLTYVYYGSSWASDDDKSGIAAAYNEAFSKLCSQEYVYLSWLQHYWNRGTAESFEGAMDKLRKVDAILMRLNEREGQDRTADMQALTKAFSELRSATRTLLLNANH